MEKARKFFEETLATEEAKKIIDSYKQKNSPDEVVRAYADIAKLLGVDLSVKEIKAYFDEKLKKCTSSGEIDDDEMALFCGGRASECSKSYIDRENCWWNDACDYINNDYTNYSCSQSYKGACYAFYVDEAKQKTPNPNPKPNKFA